MIKKIIKQLPERGDTIVEVMISTAILAVVLATAYATSNHSLQTGFNSQYRDQALSYAQQQVELIKNADNLSSATLSTYQQNQFCIDPSTSHIQAVDSSSHTCPWPIGSSPTQYSLVDGYDSSNKTYSTTVEWTSSGGVPDQVVLYYKAHDSFVTTPNAFQPPTAPTQTQPPTVGLSFYPASKNIAYGGSDTLYWSSSNATSCTASGGWNSTITPNTPGSQQLGPLTRTTTYNLSCTNGGSTNSQSVTITVAPPLPPVITQFYPDNNPINYGSATTIHWSSTNANSCSGNFSTGGATSGSAYTGGLTTTTTYTLSCTNIGGTTSRNLTIVVYPPPPPPPVPIAETLPPYFSGSSVYFQSYINPQGTYTNYYYQWSNSPSFSGCVLYDNDSSGFHLGAQDYNWYYDSSWGRTTINGVTTPVNYYNCNSHTYYVRACAYNANGTNCGAVYRFDI